MVQPRATPASSRKPPRQARGALLGLLAITLILMGGCARNQPDRADMSPVYVALGASDAVGIGAARPTDEGWVPLVAAGLPDNARLVNLGVSGATLTEIIAGQLPIATDAAPRWVTLWPGPNDFRNGVPLDRFTAQLDQILAALRPPGATDDPARRVAVLNLPDLRAIPVFASVAPDTLDARVRQWNAAIAATVARHADYAILVDLYADRDGIATHPEYISGDGFHPSSAGYRRVADVTLATLRAHDPTLPH